MVSKEKPCESVEQEQVGHFDPGDRALWGKVTLSVCVLHLQQLQRFFWGWFFQAICYGFRSSAYAVFLSSTSRTDCARSLVLKGFRTNFAMPISLAFSSDIRALKPVQRIIGISGLICSTS